MSWLTDFVKAYIEKSIDVEEAGLEVGPAPELFLVAELKGRLNQEPKLKVAFEALTMGRQREYNLHFKGAKLEKPVRHESRNRLKRSGMAKASGTVDL